MTGLTKLTWVELKLLAREPFAVIFTIVFPLIVLLSLAGSFDLSDPDFGGQTPADYYLVSYLAVVIAAVGLVAQPVHVAAYRERGILRRFHAAAVPGVMVLAAQLLVGLLMCVVGAGVLLVAARLIYGVTMPDNVGLAVLAFLIGAPAFLAFGFLLGVKSRTARAAQAIGLMLFFPLWLLSGAGPPPAVMGDVVRDISAVLPLTLVVGLLQDAWFGEALDVAHMAILAAGFAVIVAIAARSVPRT